MMKNALSPRSERTAGLSLWAVAAVTLAILLVGGAIVLEGPAVTKRLQDRMEGGPVIPRPGGILEVNRFRVWREALPNGKELMKVESMAPATGGLTNPAGVPNISER